MGLRPVYIFFKSFIAGTVFIRQNLTSKDVRFWRMKTVRTMKGLTHNGLAEKRILNHVFKILNYEPLPGMTGPPISFTARSSVTLTAILFQQPAVYKRYSRRLPKNSDAMKLRRILQVPMKTKPFFIGTITFKNGGHCVRASRCHQGNEP